MSINSNFLNNFNGVITPDKLLNIIVDLNIQQPDSLDSLRDLVNILFELLEDTATYSSVSRLILPASVIGFLIPVEQSGLTNMPLICSKTISPFSPPSPFSKDKFNMAETRGFNIYVNILPDSSFTFVYDSTNSITLYSNINGIMTIKGRGPIISNFTQVVTSGDVITIGKHTTISIGSLVLMVDEAKYKEAASINMTLCQNLFMEQTYIRGRYGIQNIIYSGSGSCPRFIKSVLIKLCL